MWAGTAKNEDKAKVHTESLFLRMHRSTWFVPFSSGRSGQNGSGLSTDLHLVVCNLCLENQQDLYERARPLDPKREALMDKGVAYCKRDLCR